MPLGNLGNIVRNSIVGTIRGVGDVVGRLSTRQGRTRSRRFKASAISAAKRPARSPTLSGEWFKESSKLAATWPGQPRALSSAPFKELER